MNTDELIEKLDAKIDALDAKLNVIQSDYEELNRKIAVQEEVLAVVGQEVTGLETFGKEMSHLMAEEVVDAAKEADSLESL